MTEDQIERNINFIVEQQAQFSADIEQLKEAQQRTQQQIKEITGALVTVVRLSGDLTEAQKKSEAKIAELAETQKKTAEQMAETNERLQIFIDVVESLFRKRHDQAEG